MDKNTTFADLGIPFPLFEAPIGSCSEFVGRGDCGICARAEQWVFRAGIGGYLLVSCSECSQTNALRCDDQRDAVCSRCQSVVAWPHARVGDFRVCYDCLRAGRVCFTQDTALGMVRWEDAQRGWTHGLPGEVESPFASKPKEDDPEWHEFALVPEDAQELGRTPRYSTWQGEQWPFHCGRVMAYVGEPLARPKSEASPDVLAATRAILEDEGWGLSTDEAWDSIICVYLFRCPVCGALGGHADCD